MTTDTDPRRADLTATQARELAEDLAGGGEAADALAILLTRCATMTERKGVAAAFGEIRVMED